MTLSIKTAKNVALLSVAAFALGLSLSACNTVEGAGQDIKSTGKAIERSAN